jgi:hypothetical protein
MKLGETTSTTQGAPPHSRLQGGDGGREDGVHGSLARVPYHHLYQVATHCMLGHDGQPGDEHVVSRGAVCPHIRALAKQAASTQQESQHRTPTHGRVGEGMRWTKGAWGLRGESGGRHVGVLAGVCVGEVQGHAWSLRPPHGQPCVVRGACWVRGGRHALSTQGVHSNGVHCALGGGHHKQLEEGGGGVVCATSL